MPESPTVGYMERTRGFYEAQGYEKGYRWAHFDDVPFQPLRKPLSASTVAVVVTSTPTGEDGRPVLPKRVSSLPVASPRESIYTNDLAWDKEATHTEDPDSFLPLRRLEELAASGRIGQVAPSFHCVPTEYSQRRTREVDAPEILERCRRDGADVAVLVPL